MARARDCSSYVVKTKAQLICTFVFTYTKSRFSHDVAHVLGVFIRIALSRQFRSALTENVFMENWLNYPLIIVQSNLSKRPYKTRHVFGFLGRWLVIAV